MLGSQIVQRLRVAVGLQTKSKAVHRKHTSLIETLIKCYVLPARNDFAHACCYRACLSALDGCAFAFDGFLKFIVDYSDVIT